MREGQRGEGDGRAQLSGAAGDERARLRGGRRVEQGLPGPRRAPLRRRILHWFPLHLGGEPRQPTEDCCGMCPQICMHSCALYAVESMGARRLHALPGCGDGSASPLATFTRVILSSPYGLSATSASSFVPTAQLSSDRGGGEPCQPVVSSTHVVPHVMSSSTGPLSFHDTFDGPHHFVAHFRAKS